MSAPPPARLAVDRVGVSFAGGLRALDGLSLEVRPGEFAALLGPSGCGKSTLLSVLCGLAEPGEGEVRIDGDAAVQRLGRVGLMPQRDGLLPWRTVLDNVVLGPVLAGEPAKAARERARAELPRFGLEGFGDAWPATLSGGMRQRAALLRMFLAGHDVVLLDEPFGALDALTRRGMQSWLTELWQQTQMTILFVTHDTDEALLLADRVHLMSARPGRVALSVDVDLPRPRDPEALAGTPAFADLRRRLLEPLLRAHDPALAA